MEEVEAEASVEREPPLPAAHERARKLRKNPPPQGVRSLQRSGERKRKVKRVGAAQRLRENPNECLERCAARDDVLFCRACKQEVSLVYSNSNMTAHISSRKHRANVVAHGRRIESNQSVHDFINHYYTTNPD